MKLRFLGTRGNVEARPRHHRMHSALLVSYCGQKVMIDCGEDWLHRIAALRLKAIVLTHAHPDHAWGLREGAPCPVYATKESWERIDDFGILDRRMIVPRRSTDIEGMTFEAFPVDHSTRAPAVGYRITAGQVTIFYVPDVVWIHDREEALSGARLYIGDGAVVTRSMVRKTDEGLVGHTPVRTQLTWCQREGVPWAIITHCGTEIGGFEKPMWRDRVQELARERGVDVEIAYDGKEVFLV